MTGTFLEHGYSVNFRYRRAMRQNSVTPSQHAAETHQNPSGTNIDQTAPSQNSITTSQTGR
ncbi:hypothetical protein HMPREF9372_2745 [Sporosarcina newyorkensis 2681]|uniref:Uncharacterized protein n=1 Tax=Sporosarcina newyorkensis 2681 TaxID=1027292 RepID=F9DVB4_9BACL|nr:hypothetical protein [Sporosarcina newyorkensis]EGQ23174.1 hypothetical protein HMPREF9372_2745 [Sporosarcina newyorkensis 2681]